MTAHGWLVRAGNNNELVDVFREGEFVAIGWPKIGDLSNVNSRESIKERYKDAYPERKIERVRVDGGTLHRFANEIGDGDLVLTYDKSSRVYYVGRINSSYEFVKADEFQEYPHRREVEWSTSVERDRLSTPTKNTLGSVLTVFSIDSCLEEIERAISDESDVEEVIEEEDAPPYIDEVESTAQELISDVVAQIDPYDFEELVAAVLRAMGYSAKTTSDGSDHGVDVVAHPDELGFENPIIKVQVKRTQSTVGNEDIGRFLGTLDPDEKGLFVSTGGYTRPAKREAESSSRRITLLDRDRFIELLLEHYDELDQEYRSFIPLKSVYIPTEVATTTTSNSTVS